MNWTVVTARIVESRTKSDRSKNADFVSTRWGLTPIYHDDEYAGLGYRYGN